MWWIWIALALPGHVALCLFASNYLNAVVVRRTLRHMMTLPIEAFLTFGPLVLLSGVWWGRWPIESAAWNAGHYLAAAYLGLAMLIAFTFVPRWFWQQLTARSPALLLSNHTSVADLAPLLRQPHGEGMGRIYLKVPGNQSLQLACHVKTLEIPALPPNLDGLTITHLSDLHFTGRIGKAYFEEVIDRANKLESDLVAITGDIVDSPRCIDWLPDTLGRLHAPQGVCFVLGNHDARAGAANVRQTLVNCGLIDLSGRRAQKEIRGVGVLLAGNELPWFRPPADMSDDRAASGEALDFRILLSHSPDQFGWAMQHGFDLMLAGHTHGGQIRFPGIGPILAPSRYGVRYAAGTYHIPPLVMHVSRGLSGLQPLRINCLPELTKLVLRQPGSDRSHTC